MTDGPVLRGRHVILAPFRIDDISERYLSWLNDPVVNAYSRRRQARKAADRASAIQYLANLEPDEVVLAVHTAADGHVGNVKYGPVDRDNLRADISILIGERPVWGQGLGAEAVYLVTRYLLETLGLHRVDAGSNNPAFLRMVEKLGWRVEGVLRERVRVGDTFRDHILVAQLSTEFRRRSEYEPA